MSLSAFSSLKSTALAIHPLIPVAHFESTEQALALVDVLLLAEFKMIEVTLRADNSLQVMEAIARQRPEICLAAGTVLSVKQLQQVQEAGAQYALSPGISSELLIAAKQQKFALIPGVATPSDIMLGLAHGYVDFKFFPAETLGGVASLKALSAPFPQARFCPTGGIDLQNFMEYLALPMVACVGMSQLLPDALRGVDQRSALAAHLRQFTHLLRAVHDC
jgi:2-dehydro-3-deoxyphosphogluconate aldolase/(4S)-4-hydroxy-2-oxoglutarate aldolase